MKVEVTCPRCYAYFEVEGAIPISVFDADSIPLDHGNIRFCIVCGALLAGPGKEERPNMGNPKPLVPGPDIGRGELDESR